jgi:thioredoxin 1
MMNFTNIIYMAREFTDANFKEEVLGSSEPVFVDFWAPWCGPCRMMGPVVDNLAHELDGKGVKIGKVNVDDNPEVAQQFGIMSIPTFIVFKDGKIVVQNAGGQTIDQLKEMIAKAK